MKKTIIIPFILVAGILNLTYAQENDCNCNLGYSTVIEDTLNGTNGFTIIGNDALKETGYSFDYAGDINNDGFDDLIISTIEAVSYVIYGNDNFTDSTFQLDNLNGSNGFVINGQNGPYGERWKVSTAGDFNKDGFDDIIIGATRTSAFGDGILIGRSYIIYGADNFGSSFKISDIDGSNGVIIDGENSSTGSSISSVGDFNNDGFDDVIIGTPEDSNFKGESYLLIGNYNTFHPLFLPTIHSNYIYGFNIIGIDEKDRSGYAVSGAGDINNDGFDDIIIGAPYARGNDKLDAGEAYVIYGTANNVPSPFQLSDLDGNNGFLISGSDIFELVGFAVRAAGDVNNDGFDDIIIGAPLARPNSGTRLGQAYVIYGGNSIAHPFNLSDINGVNGFSINGFDDDTLVGEKVSGGGDINNDGFDDIIISSRVSYNNKNISFILYGGNDIGSSIELENLSSKNGFSIYSEIWNESFSTSIGSGGDFNNDGFDDVLIGIPRADINENYDGGKSYVIYGRCNFINGCTDAAACNYNPLANCNDDSCFIAKAGEIINCDE